IFICRWIEEESVINEAYDRGDGAALSSRRGANDGNGSELWVEEHGGLGHDQIRLEQIRCWSAVDGRCAIIRVNPTVEIREREVAICDVGGIAGCWAVARAGTAFSNVPPRSGL